MVIANLQGNNPIHLAISLDRNYLTQTYVLLTSVFTNNAQNSFIIHTIATGLLAAEEKELMAYARQHQSEIIFYRLGDTKVNGLSVPQGSHFSIATYYRLFFPAWCPRIWKSSFTLIPILLLWATLANCTKWTSAHCLWAE